MLCAAVRLVGAACSSFWLLFYLIEAAAILTILRKYPDDSKEAVSCMTGAWGAAGCPARSSAVRCAAGGSRLAPTWVYWAGDA